MRVKVSSPNSPSVRVNGQGTSEIVSIGIQGPTGPVGPSTLLAINSATDVDVTDLQDGSILVYETSTSKWTSTTSLHFQDIEAGEF